jgi:hypothetical protein
MTHVHDFPGLNSIKANFDAIYSQPDPREYFRVLCGLDYVIPELARVPFAALTAALRRRHGRKLRIADIGCSYGINAALLRYPLDIQRLSGRYAAAEMQALDSRALAGLDRNYFRSWPVRNRDCFVGVDTSRPAADYALKSGLIEAAVTTNMEESDPTPAEAAALSGLNLVISTGCVGYVTARTLDRILAQQRSNAMPWIANLVLRIFPYDGIADALSRHGLVTEKLEGVTFVQRRFHSEQEYAETLKTLRRLGVRSDGKEADGLFHAELYVSRPAEDVAAMPLSELVSITSGAGRRYGRRYARTPGGVKLMS